MKSRVTQFKFKGSVLLLLLTAGILALTPVSENHRASAATAESGALRKSIFGRSERLPVYGLFDAAVDADGRPNIDHRYYLRLVARHDGHDERPKGRVITA